MTDFPLYVKISADTDIGAHAQTDGDDIRFTLADGVTVIPHETESFSIDSESATGHFWVKVPTVSSASTTDIYVYYGNSEAEDGQDPDNVWDDNFELVHHFGEDSWDGTSGEIIDSTSNDYHGVRVGDATTTSSGKIGRGGTFDGNGDYGTSGDATVSGNFTMSFWCLHNSGLDEEADAWYGHPVYKTSSDFHMGWQGWSDGWSVSFQDSNDTNRSTGSLDQYVTASTWYHIVGIYDGSNLKIYIDSTLIRDISVGSYSVMHDGTNLYTGHSWDGLMDEVRVSSTNRSADWIKFEYRNMAEADNELTFSAEEQAPQVSPLSNLIGNPYLFTGRRFDRETGLYYYRARYYDPNIGRFLQTDPIGQGFNLYAYCGNNPLGFVDPSGMIMESFDWGGFASDLGIWRDIFTDTNIDLGYTFYIPLDDVWDYENDPEFTEAFPDGVPDWWFQAHAESEVMAFLEDTGFFGIDMLKNMNISVEYTGSQYKVTIADGCDVDVRINLGILGQGENSLWPGGPILRCGAPVGFPFPPGWTPDSGWEWIDDPRDPVGGGRWRSPDGSIWRPHPDPTGEHEGDHYDWNPRYRRGRRHRIRIPVAPIVTVGAGIVIIGGVAYIISTGGTGALILIPVVAM